VLRSGPDSFAGNTLCSMNMSIATLDPHPLSALAPQADITPNETYDARLSLDVDRRIADNFVYWPRLGKHRHMA
jgi:hypothetical protein